MSFVDIASLDTSDATKLRYNSDLLLGAAGDQLVAVRLFPRTATYPGTAANDWVGWSTPFDDTLDLKVSVYTKTGVAADFSGNGTRDIATGLGASGSIGGVWAFRSETFLETPHIDGITGDPVTGLNQTETLDAHVSTEAERFVLYTTWCVDPGAVSIDSTTPSLSAPTIISGSGLGVEFRIGAISQAEEPSMTAQWDVSGTTESIIVVRMVAFGLGLTALTQEWDVLSTVATIDHDILVGVEPDQHHAESHDFVGTAHLEGLYYKEGVDPAISDGDFTAPVDGMAAVTYDTNSGLRLLWARSEGTWKAVEV